MHSRQPDLTVETRYSSACGSNSVRQKPANTLTGWLKVRVCHTTMHAAART